MEKSQPRGDALWWTLGGLAGAVLLGALGWFVFGGGPQAAPGGGPDLAREKLSEAGHFRVAIAPVQEAGLNELHAWSVRLSAPDGRPLSGAQLAVEGAMPAHGHGLPTQPQAAPSQDEGVYLVEGVRFNMSGHWTLTLNIEAGGQRDRVTFDLQVAP